MLSLAPLKYRNILKKNGGPVEKLTWVPTQISFEEEGFEASCLLTSELRKKSESFELYANVDGTGSDTHKATACYKAISESLERWAYYETSSSPKSTEYGFHIDSSTSGMAAFPGIVMNQVVRRARSEALERWALAEWWSGNLSAKRRSVHGIDCIEIPVPGYGVVCISWLKRNNAWAYGFSCSDTFDKAFGKSQIELFRNIYVLSQFRGEFTPIKLQEKRLIFFSCEEGHNLFIGVVEKSLRVRHSITPRPVLSKEVVGPWSHYCSVWRCLFFNTEIDQEALEVFLF